MPAVMITHTILIDDTPSSPSDTDTVKDLPLDPLPLPKALTTEKSPTEVQDPFSIVGAPKLERFVTMDHLPDILVVYDKGDITNRCPDSLGRTPVYYRRAYPKAERTPKNPRRATLFLDTANEIERGRRSSVYQAPLFATLGPRGDPRKRVLVAAKVANNTCRCHQLLRDEARGYATFPEPFYQLSDPSSCTLGPDTPIFNHRPALRPRGFPGWAAVMNPKPSPARAAVPPIAPKFYGFYVPIESEKSMRSLARTHRDCEDFQNSNCDVSHWPKCITLMEDCGRRIDPVALLTQHREQCLKLVERMHLLGFSHGHARMSNMLVQPGPIWLPQEQRSMDTPSFRLISLGRWRGMYHPLAKESPQGASRAYNKGRQNDLLLAMHELGMIDAMGPDVE